MRLDTTHLLLVGHQLLLTGFSDRWNIVVSLSVSLDRSHNSVSHWLRVMIFDSFATSDSSSLTAPVCIMEEEAGFDLN